MDCLLAFDHTREPTLTYALLLESFGLVCQFGCCLLLLH